MAWFDFSSGKNGNIFDFVMATEGLSFREAVERLAGEAGVPSWVQSEVLPNAIAGCAAVSLAPRLLRSMTAPVMATLVMAHGGRARSTTATRRATLCLLRPG
jgi:hypothetical protein